MKSRTISAVILVLVKFTTAKDLFTELDESTANIAECGMDDIESCTKIDFDFDILKNEDDFVVDGETFTHSYTDGQTYGYETDDYGSAVFVYNNTNGHQEVEGDLIFEGKVWRIDGCGENCHILVKLGWDTLQSLPDGEPMAPVIRPHEFDQGMPSDRVLETVSKAKFHVIDRLAITNCVLPRSRCPTLTGLWIDNLLQSSPLRFTTHLNLSRSLAIIWESLIIILLQPTTPSNNQALMFSFSFSALKR